MKKRKDIYVVGYTGSGNYNATGQPIWGQPARDEDGKRLIGGGEAIHPLTLKEAEEEIKELVTHSPKAIYKIVQVKRFRQ